MLKIRLTRVGKRNQPAYRIIVTEARSKRDGKYLEQLGIYQPLNKKNPGRIDLDQYKQWLKKGAQPTDRVRKLVEKWTN